jgi:lipoyl(octanoyl) transferase
MQNHKTFFQHLGVMPYKQAWEYQTQLFDGIIQQKLENRLREEKGLKPIPTPNFLLFTEHPHVYTMGKMGDEKNLLLSVEELEKKGIEYYATNRGGDITYHGFGQIVGYPIFDLDNFFTDIHRYLRTIEEAVILTLADYDIKAGRIEKLTGVWVDENKSTARKICAIGVKSSRWVTMHGFAFNVNTDIAYFKNIVPCGIQDKGVTTMAREIGVMLEPNEVEERLLHHLTQLFGLELIKMKNTH